MKLLNKYKFLLIIIAIAAFLRLYNLAVVPVGPNWDEAALGYNAYSILKTGKDEYGTVLPLSLRSYDDYKPPLYMYLTVPSVFLFGLNLWATRLPAAVNGIIAVIGCFFLAQELFSYSEYLKKKKILPYVSSFLLAISPWHLQFSRMAFEANIGVTLNIWAVYFFIRGVQKGKFLSASAILFALSLYAYHSQRVFAPLLITVLTIFFWKELMKNLRSIVMAIIIGILTIAPLIPVFLNPTTLTRLKGTSALSDTTGILKENVIKLQRDADHNNKLGLIFDNRRIVYANILMNGYLSHYSFRWLFLEGDNARHHAPGMGLLYFIELPMLLLGCVYLAKKGKRVTGIIFGWMLIAPVAASPTTELPHAIRTLVFLPTFQLIVSIGILFLVEQLYAVKKFVRYGVTILLSILFIFNFIYYLSSYYIQQNQEYSEFWQYGYREAVEYVKAHYDEYSKIVVSTKLEQPHMFFLFFLKYDPSMYLKEGGTASGGFKEVKNKFGKYEFRPIVWDNEKKDGTILYIGAPSEIYGNQIETINYINGKEAIRIAR